MGHSEWKKRNDDGDEVWHKQRKIYAKKIEWENRVQQLIADLFIPINLWVKQSVFMSSHLKKKIVFSCIAFIVCGVCENLTDLFRIQIWMRRSNIVIL